MNNSEFYDSEKLYRAVLPKLDMYIKTDGSISSAAFKSADNEALSVDRQMNRPNQEAVEFISNQKKGYIVSFTVKNCKDKDINIEYDPVLRGDIYIYNPFHTVIFKNEEQKRLSNSQAKHLSRCCVTEMKRDL